MNTLNSLPDSLDKHRIVSALRAHMPANVPELLGIYAFGSRVQGTHHARSDLDLAVLVAGRVDQLILWEWAQQLADDLGNEVDLIDLRAASTVMQYQIICSGECLWARDAQAPIYESFILSEKTALDHLRAGLLEDIERDGSVYGR